MTDPTAPSEIAGLGTDALLRAYRDRALSPVDVIEDVLARIETVNPQVNAFCHVDSDGALAAARASEARWLRGEALGLDGIPVSVKDLQPVRGMPLRKGSRTTSSAPAEEDAPFVASFRRLGAVILGKTTTPEFGWKGVTDSPLTGITRNPWNTGKTPGGSSGGAAAAAALNLGVLHQGTDGGGSIRIPAAMTGTVGLKPTFGWIPQVPPSVMTLLSHLGPIARTIDDLEHLFTAMAVPDSRDWTAIAPGRLSLDTNGPAKLDGLRIAYSPSLGHAEVDGEVAASVQRAVVRLEELGARVEEIDPGFEDPIDLFKTFWFSGAARALQTFDETDLSTMDPGLVAVAEEARAVSAIDYLNADAARFDLGVRMNAFHSRFDFLVTPTLAVSPFDVGCDTPRPTGPGDWTYWTPFTYPFNITQQPALSVPCDPTPNGLPVGLQIVARRFDDARVLNAGRAYLAAFPSKFPDRPRTNPLQENET
ncbi:MAG: amidase [Pseudomonadota bacterium]